MHESVHREDRAIQEGFLNVRTILLNPASTTLVVVLLLITWVIAQERWDPMSLVRVGTRFSELDPNGTDGYDGQFVYYIARELNPEKVSPYIDNPPYRYQRILLPVLGRALSFGDLALIPWTLPAIGIISHVLGTWMIMKILEEFRINPWYALIYGLWSGFLLAIRLDLPEPLAYALVIGAVTANRGHRPALSWFLFGLAIFAKEVTFIFALSQLGYDLWKRRYRHVIGLVIIAIIPYLLFQIWLWSVFGSPGIGSGGAMATPFEFIPFMGFLRIADFSLLLMFAFLVVFGPSIFFPAVWGVWEGVKRWLLPVGWYWR
jgi:hypothetical protein